MVVVAAVAGSGDNVRGGPASLTLWPRAHRLTHTPAAVRDTTLPRPASVRRHHPPAGTPTPAHQPGQFLARALSLHRPGGGHHPPVHLIRLGIKACVHVTNNNMDSAQILDEWKLILKRKPTYLRFPFFVIYKQ